MTKKCIPDEVRRAATFVEFWKKRVHTSNERRQRAIVRVIKLGKKHGLSLRDIGGVLKMSGQIVNYYIRRYGIE